MAVEMGYFVLVGDQQRHQVVVILLDQVQFALSETHLYQDWVGRAFRVLCAIIRVDIEAFLVQFELSRQIFD